MSERAKQQRHSTSTSTSLLGCRAPLTHALPRLYDHHAHSTILPCYGYPLHQSINPSIHQSQADALLVDRTHQGHERLAMGRHRATTAVVGPDLAADRGTPTRCCSLDGSSWYRALSLGSCRLIACEQGSPLASDIARCKNCLAYINPFCSLSKYASHTCPTATIDRYSWITIDRWIDGWIATDAWR